MTRRSSWLRWTMVAGISALVLIGPAAAQVVLDAGESTGYPGWKIDLAVSLSLNGTSPSSVAHALFFPDPRYVKPAARPDGKPDCRLTANVGTPAEFVFWPVGCVHEDDECDTVRVLLVDLSGTQPALPSGELFRCSVQISGSAPPGTYTVNVRDPDAGARGGLDVPASGADGAVVVLQPPGGGGGCNIAPTANLRAQGIFWELLLFLGFALAFRRGSTSPCGGRPGRAARALLVATTVSCVAANAFAQPAEFAAEGSWSSAARQGAWRAVLGIDSNGALSGRVTFQGLDVLPEANILAVWSRGALQQGSVFRPGGILRLGRLRGTFGAGGVKGEISLADGTLLTWKLEAIRATREKVTPLLASQLLARGQGAAVQVTIDDYAAIREARRLVHDLARYEFDTEQAEAAYNAAITRLQEATIQSLKAVGAVILSRPRGVPQVRVYLRDWASLTDVLSLPEVIAVQDPQVYSLTLSESLPLIGQPAAMSRGFNGLGATVAIVDTRMDHLRPLYPGGPLAFGEGCANGVGAPGCAIVATFDAAGGRAGEEEGPEHGTNVAGISWSVAPASRIAGVDVFKAVGADDDDIISGLNWVKDNSRRYNIVAANLSLGGGRLVTCARRRTLRPKSAHCGGSGALSSLPHRVTTVGPTELQIQHVFRVSCASAQCTTGTFLVPSAGMSAKM